MHKKLNLFGGWFGLPGKRRAKKSGRSAGTARRLPQIEPLEKRWLLSVVTWTGGGADNQFGTAANWSTGTVPTGNDNVVIPADAGTLLVVGAAAVTSLEIQGDGVTLQGGTGASIAVSGGNIIVDSGTAVIAVALAGCNGLSKQGAGTLELSAPNSYSGDTTVNAGSLVLDSGVSLSDGNGLSVAAGTTLALGNLNGGTPVFSRALPARFAPDATPDLSTAGVVYANGGVIVTADDLGLGTTRTYDNRQNPTQSGGLGSGWTLDGQPYVAANSNRAAVVLGPTQSYWFSNNAPLFTPLDGAKETLTADTADHLLDFAMPDGTVYTFNDFSYSDALAGQFVARYSPGGGIERVTATADDGQIAAIRWQVSASAAPYQAEIFSYDTAAQDPANVGRLESIVLQGYDGTSLVNTREVTYGYYNGVQNSGNGRAGDLESATEQFWDPTLNGGGGGWTNGGDSYYYRYCVSGPGSPYCLRMALTPQEVQNAGGLAAVESASTSDNALAPYAAETLQYDAFRHVTQATLDGLYTYQYSYTASVFFQSSANTWQYETTETRPDGSTYTVYTNPLGETLLTDLADTASDNWYTAWRYGPSGSSDALLVEKDMPSAIAWVTANSNGSITLAAPAAGQPQGLVYDYSYYGDSSGSPGYLYQETLKNGLNAAASSAVLVDQYAYAAQSGETDGMPVTVHPLAAETVYPVAGGTGNETDYSYTWYAGSVQVQQETTTLPIVTPAQNGPGGATHWTEQDAYDPAGNLAWEKDADGNLTYHAHDPVTGRETETIADAGSSSGLALPSGWSYLHAGINAATNYSYDPLGRIAQVLGPVFVDDAGDTVRTATWTTYLDAGHEVRTASGDETLSSGGYTLVNPIAIMVFDRDGQATDEIQAEDGSGLSVARSSSAAILSELASAALPTSSYSSWTHNDYAAQADTSHGYHGAGYLIDAQVYTAIQATPPAYTETFYRYDSMGRQNEAEDSPPTITQTVYDARGLVTSVFAGSSDGTLWPGQSGPPAASNMAETTANQYDGGSPGGDGLLTRTTQYVDATPADNLVTLYAYDWRDRLTTTTSSKGTTTTVDVNVYDNQDRAIEQSAYQGSVAEANRIGESLASYDNLGRVYQTTVSGVDPSTGAEISGSLVSNTWYDPAGNVIETQASDSQDFTKTAYDGLARPTALYDGFDPSGGAATYASAGSVSGDTVLDQTNTRYDATGGTTLATTFTRSANAPAGASGALDALGAADSTASYAAYWYDGIGRQTAEQDFGTMAAAPTPGSSKPPTDTSGLTQVSLTIYNARGEPWVTIDPAGNVTCTTYDDAGNVLQTVQSLSAPIAPDTDVATDNAPDAQGHVALAASSCPGSGASGNVVNQGAATGNNRAVDDYFLELGRTAGTTSPQVGIDLCFGQENAAGQGDYVDQLKHITERIFAETGGANNDAAD